MEATSTLEEDINPRTGLPYKTSKKTREAKARWAKKNPGASAPYIKSWIENNRERWNELSRNNQYKVRLRYKYLTELFSEGLQIGDITIDKN